MSPLPDQREQLAAGALLARLPIRHHALRRAENRHAESVANARNLRDGDVFPEPRRGYPPHLTNYRLAALRVLEHDAQQLPAVIGVQRLVVLNEVVLLQDFGDLHLQLRDRHVYAPVLRPPRLSTPRE